MKVLLINPPDENMIIADNPSFIDTERGFNPPLGLLYIASYAIRNTNCEIEILDCLVEGIGYVQLEERIKSSKPDLVGITAMTFTLIDVINTANIVKRVSPRTKIILGGPHAHIYPEETLSLPDVDFVITGEGEVSFTEFIHNIDHPEKYSEIEGLFYKDKSGNIFGRKSTRFIENLDDIPFPVRHLSPYQKYWSILAKRRPITTMFTSRGCPFKCSFCDRPQMGRRFRARSAKNVVDEMVECAQMGIREFLIYDDTFTVDKQRVMDICDEIIERNLDIGWDIRTRVDMVDEEMLFKLKAANCERIHYGVEAGTEKVLKALNKGVTLQQVERVFELTKKAGISTLAYFMIGSPGETREDIIKTIEFAKKLDPDYVHATITTPFPATELYFQALKENVILEDYWRLFAQNPRKDIKTQYWEKELKKEQLLLFLKYFYKSFYGRPHYIIKNLLKIRSSVNFNRKIKAGFKILFSREFQ